MNVILHSALLIDGDVTRNLRINVPLYIILRQTQMPGEKSIFGGTSIATRLNDFVDVEDRAWQHQ